MLNRAGAGRQCVLTVVNVRYFLRERADT